MPPQRLITIVVAPQLYYNELLKILKLDDLFFVAS